MTGQTETPTRPKVEVSAIPGSAPTGDQLQSIRSLVGAYRTDDHQYFMNGVGPYFGVTSMLNVIESPELAAWNRRVVAECAIEGYAELGSRIQTDGAQAAGDWLQGAPGRQRDTSAVLGSRIHRLADMVARGQEMTGEGYQVSAKVQPYLEAFLRFLDRFGASNIVSSEKMVISFAEGYAGTYDFLLMLNGELWLVDLKTGRTLPPKIGLQLAAYGNAEYIILPNDPNLYPMVRPAHYGVLHLRPEKYPEKGYRFVEYGVEERDYRAFLSARDLWAWRKEGRFRYPQIIT